MDENSNVKASVRIRGEEFSIVRKRDQPDIGLVWLDVEPSRWLRMRLKMKQFAKLASERISERVSSK